MKFIYVVLISCLFALPCFSQKKPFGFGAAVGTNVNPTWANSEEVLAPGWSAGLVGWAELHPRLAVVPQLGVIYERVAWDHQWPYLNTYSEDWEAYWLEGSTVLSAAAIVRERWQLWAGLGLSVKAYCGGRVTSNITDEYGDNYETSDASADRTYYNWGFAMPIQLAYRLDLKGGQGLVVMSEYHQPLRDKIEYAEHPGSMYQHEWMPYSKAGLLTLKVAWMFPMGVKG